MRHNNEYTVGTLAAGKGPIYKTPDEAVDDVAFSDESTAVIGTPDDLVAKIHDMMELTGGFGCVIGFVHDWANRENTRRSLGPRRPVRRPKGQRAAGRLPGLVQVGQREPRDVAARQRCENEQHQPACPPPPRWWRPKGWKARKLPLSR